MMVKEVQQRKVFSFHLKLYFMRQKKRKAKRHEFERSHVCYRKLYCSFGVGLGRVGLGLGIGGATIGSNDILINIHQVLQIMSTYHT